MSVPISKKQDRDGKYHLQAVATVDDLQVANWAPGDVEQGDKPTQIHILFTPPMEQLIAAYNLHHGIPIVAIRLKSRAVVDSLIDALISHRDELWPDESESK